MNAVDSNGDEAADRRADWSSLLAFAADALPTFLMRQRWYPAKDAAPPKVTLAHHVPVEAELAAAIAVWSVAPPGRAAFQLFVPLALFADSELTEAEPAAIGRPPGNHGVLGEATHSDAFVRYLVRIMLQPGASSIGVQAGRTTAEACASTTLGIQAGRTTAVGGLEVGDPWLIRRSQVEQSNTSIRVGDGAILKVIRKLEQGIHPELEMGRFLTERTTFEAMPALLGWVDMRGSTLCILQAFVVNQGDGWAWILARLRGPAEERQRALRWVRKLGERTAQLHGALAAVTGDPAFDPQPALAADWQSAVGHIEEMARRVVQALKERGATLDASTRLIADEFAWRSGELPKLLHALLPGEAVAKTRHHGDFHLGQVLVRGDDVTLVDFEGEPLRSLEERRAKQVPLRDVAGMLRSFDYAAAVAERGQPRTTWSAEAAEHYLGGYFSASRDAAAHGADPQAARLVKFFSIEKALYEVLYEIANRPDWVSIPLGSVLDLLGQEPGESAARVPVRRAHRLPLGAELEPGGGVTFRLWAPGCTGIQLELQQGPDVQRSDMTAVGEGWYESTAPAARAGTRYRYVLPDGTRVPDPASRFQPDDVQGASEVIDPRSFEWQDGGWTPRPWHEAVIYELHIGAFTRAGTFLAAIERLDHLVALGVTAIEIMPVADFPGTRNWGYDGVLLYAPDSSYGRPDDLKALVDAAHARGLMVLLDVVYNHFGPDGNYLPAYAPGFFTDRHKTPWGAAVNYDGRHSAPVREFVIHNALYWIEEYHLDGLRLDAVHAILDDGSRHVLDELADRVRALGPVHLVLENEENQAQRLLRGADGAPRHYTAQWNDDVHHVLHVAVSGEDKGYYAEYLGDTEKLARALAEGFAFQGEMMEFRGEARGEPSAMLPPTAFVAFIQNHDQVGNRAFGERLTAIAPAAAVRAAAALYLLLPQVPMLFMGEEWGAAQPFPFFCDFHGELAEAVRKGRREEFAKFPEFRDEALRQRIPDPQAEGTFESAKLAWTDLDRPEHAAWHQLYRRLLAVRREWVIPLLPRIGGHAARYEVLGSGALVVRWRAQGGGQLTLAANLSSVRVEGFAHTAGRVLWQEGAAAQDHAGPWFVRWSLE